MLKLFTDWPSTIIWSIVLIAPIFVFMKLTYIAYESIIPGVGFWVVYYVGMRVVANELTFWKLFKKYFGYEYILIFDGCLDGMYIRRVYKDYDGKQYTVFLAERMDVYPDGYVYGTASTVTQFRACYRRL